MSDSERGSRIRSFKTVAEILAIVIGGCWVFFRYLSHERDAAALALEQQTLAMTIEQQRLATDQSRLSLAIAESQRRLRDVELSQNVKLKGQELALGRLQQKKTQQEVVFGGRYRYGRQFDVVATKVRNIDEHTGEYRISYSSAISNKSTVPFEISLLALDYYVGMAKNVDASTPIYVAPIGTPANRWNGASYAPGALDWKLIGSAGSVLDSAFGNMAQDANRLSDELNLTVGGGGVGVISGDQTFVYDDTFYVRAPTTAYICFVMNYCFERCRTGLDYYYHSDSIPLEDITVRSPAGKSQPL